MSIRKLAWYNFKKSFRNYFSMILSLAFTVLIVFNFINLIFTGTFRALGERNKSYIDIIIQVISFVLFCFMFFFIWYATNVFLTTRKKEIGIYIFMGLTNRKIASLYMLETIMTGIAALILGICSGIVTTQLFQMILLRISEIAIDISFSFAWEPILLTALIYTLIYAVFVLKGYLNIVKSSVLEMISASRQNEYVKTNGRFLLLKAILGIIVLGSGYYLAVYKSGHYVIENLLGATVLVCAGTYLVFGGFLPMLFQYLAGRKSFLYRHERNLWVNNVIFRMRKNYRTYAMTCILLTCSVTALAASFATKEQYENMQHFRNTYTFQIVSSIPDMEKETAELIEKDNDIEYSSFLPWFGLDGSYFSNGFGYGFLSFSNVKKAAADAGLDFPYESLGDDEMICATHIYLMSFITDKSGRSETIGGKTYRVIEETQVPYMGYLQESTSFYIVSDRTYEELLSLCRQKDPQEGKFSENYTYNYKIKDIYNYAASLDELDKIVHSTEESYTGRVAIDPEDDETVWIKVEYSLCVFVFLVFVLASGSILFMKLYNDAFEEKERCDILRKIGVSGKVLGKAAAKELRTAYAMPFVLMTISSCFAIHALELIMSNNLKSVNIASIAIIFVVLVCFYMLSVVFYKKNASIHL
ncbi:MAG: ABC transporter permease [Roseburia sp.]|nr:ABC transporter permease [Roseburia sp.]MCM1242416.1 ABC transporter permease [Roseburia sp.]